MASAPKEVAFDMSPFFRLFKDGTIDRFGPLGFHPTSEDPTAAVRSKDVQIDPATGLSVRIFAPRRRDPPRRLPVVVYIHGGAFCIGSATSPPFHAFVSTVVERAGAIAVSIDYRLAPENPLPAAFDDSWAAFRWVAAHAAAGGGGDRDPWLAELADLRRVFVGGESAGATIANDVAVRAGAEPIAGVEIAGVFLIHPFFGGREEDALYRFLCPASSGRDDDPRLFPAADPRIGRMAGRRVMFLVAEKDFLIQGAWGYYEGLKRSAWAGEVEIVETKGEGHCFHLWNPNSEKAVAVMDRLVAFITTP